MQRPPCSTASVDSATDPLTACVAGRRDGCVVDTAPLAQLVREFTAQWERQHRSAATTDTLGRLNSGSRCARDEHGHFVSDPDGQRDDAASALEELASRTKAADPLGRGVPRDTISKVLGNRYQSTELRIADPLVAAMRKPMAFYDGTLHVRPNPQASRQARGACCNGSSTFTSPNDVSH